jgi:DNA-binding transcriptional ArsR family regulator
MEEDKVILDRRSFEALAVDSRVRILKSLRARRKTLSELAQELDMSVSGVKEHLEMLESADLVKKMDDGHKWKYYELSKKGADLMAPKELKVWVLLSVAMVALVVSMLAMLPADALTYGTPLEAASAPQADAGAGIMVKAAIADNISAMNNPDQARSMNTLAATQGAMEFSANDSSSPPSAQSAPDYSLPLLVGGVSILTIIACVGILFWNRTKAASG